MRSRSISSTSLLSRESGRAGLCVSLDEAILDMGENGEIGLSGSVLSSWDR